MADLKGRAAFANKREEILQKLLGNPSKAELQRLQLHIQVLEHWDNLGREEHHDHEQGVEHQDHEHKAA